MNGGVLERLLSRLQRKLGLEDAEEDVILLLEDELEDAECELLLFLNREELPAALEIKAVELAALYYRRDSQEQSGLKSASYSEGDVSQSESYLTGAEYQAEVDALLASVLHWRRRAT